LSPISQQLVISVDSERDAGTAAGNNLVIIYQVVDR